MTDETGRNGQHPAPLVITGDQSLLDHLLRLAAAAGVTPVTTAEPTSVLGRWPTAPVVLVGGDLAAEAARHGPDRREEVYVVTAGPAPDHLFRTALDLGAAGVVETGLAEDWLVEVLGREQDPPGPPGPLVGVVGGSGGSGATTFACALARVAARRAPSLVVDADPLGPGLDRVLGAEDEPGVRWRELERTTGRIGAVALRDAVPRQDGLGVLTWHAGPQGSLQAFAVRQVLAAGVRGHDLVVVDLPRAGGEVVAEVAARCDLLVVLVRPSVVGVAAAARTRARLAGARAAGLVVRGVGADPRGVGAAVGAPVLAEMGEQRGLAEALDLGRGPVPARRGPLYRAVSAVLDRVAPPAAAA
jgi:secretion/DNA translocation related CpaE-like protein